MKVSILTLTLSFIITPLCYSMTPDWQLSYVVFEGNLQQVQEALHNGANINSNNYYRGYTPLHCAAHWNRSTIVEFLITHGANVNSKTIKGRTPLHYAAKQGYSMSLKLLLDAGANVNVQDNKGNTPLHEAMLLNYTAIVKLLLHAGANITLKNKKGYTALDVADDPEIIKILEEYSLLNKEAQESPTPKTLHNAIQSNYSSIVKLLLQHGINATEANLELAKQLNYKEIGAVLIKYLGATTGQSLISRSGINRVNGITPEIAQRIMSYTL